MMRNRKVRLPLFAMFVACAAASLAFADQVVYFVNGKAILVKSVEKGAKFTVLEMDGGGRMGVPTDQIARIEEYVVSPPSAPQPAVPLAPVAPAAQVPAAGPLPTAVAAPAVAAPVGAPAPPAVPGPGIGGRTAAPNGGIPGLRPLDLSASGTASGVMQRPYPQGAAGPVTPGPGNQMLGSGAMRRNNFGPGRQFQGRPGMFGGRGGRFGGQNPNAPSLAPSGKNAQPAPTQPQAPSVQPPPNPAAEEAPPPPDDSDNDSSDEDPPQEGEPSGDSPGSAS